MALGLQPHLLSETLIESMLEMIGRYQYRVIVDHIQPATRWRGVRERSPG
jgi:UDP-sulfoquinovose synthase